jgi:hypothetical protein
MAIHLPERRYFTFAELQRRWTCEANDVRDIVCSGAIAPSWHVNESMPWAKWVADEDAIPKGSKLVPTIRDDFSGGAWLTPVNEWLFLRCPHETGRLSCAFDMLCTSATDPPELDDGFPPMADWFYLHRKIDLMAVEDQGVFLLTEVARFEAAVSAPSDVGIPSSSSSPRKAEMELGTRERHTLLTMIAALSSMAKLELDKPSKAAEAIANGAQLCGITLSKRTVEEKLKLVPGALAARGR